LVEELEPRVLLTGPPPQAFTPQEIAHAYGFDRLVLPNGIAADGAGQTIAIFSTGHYANIVSDLQVFAATLLGSTATPNFTFGFPQGQPSNLPGDALESAADLETIYALVPNAHILFVELPDDGRSSYAAAAVYAAQQGASVMSMSYGGQESASQTQFDYAFNQPGVTYVFSTGDNGAPGEYPSTSPYVVAAGGTTLYLDAQGNYLYETAWSINSPAFPFGGGAGGISAFEPQPVYQQGRVTQSTTFRTTPDLSFQADVSPGIPVYYTTDFNTNTQAWSNFGGTSHAAPALAAMFILVQQGRAALGLAPLSSQEMLAGLYSAPPSAFNDIVSGYNGRYFAGPGYDLTTGLGSPIVQNLVPFLIGFGAPRPTASAATYQVNAHGTLNVSTAAGLANFAQSNLAAAPTLSFSLVQGPRHGTLSLNADGSFTYTPSAGYAGIDSFVYQASNYVGSSVPTTVTLRVVPSYLAVGADAGAAPQVVVYDAVTGTMVGSFFAFNPSFTGGVRVALGDINGDAIPEIICAAGPGGGPQVTVYDAVTLQPVRSLFAFAPSFTGGVYVAAGDVNGDGRADIICGAGAGGGPQVTIFSGADGSVLASFFAFPPTFAGGVRVAAGDLNGDSRADIIAAAGPGGGPQVTAFDGKTQAVLFSFFAHDPTFSGGVFVTAGDVTGDGLPEIVCGAGAGGGPQVSIFSGANGVLRNSFFALPSNFAGGVRVGFSAAAGAAQRPAILATAGPGGGPQVSLFDGATVALLDSFFAPFGNFSGGLFVAG